MEDLPGYVIDGLLHNSSSSAVYRAHREDDGRRVVVKCPQSEPVSARQLTRYRNEYAILDSIASEGVIRVHDLLRHKGSLALILEEFDGIALKQWLRQCEPNLEQRLEVAVQIAATIGEVHAAGVIHKDINSQNILIDPKTRRTTLIDFGIATRLRSEQSKFQFPSALEGTLAYIAPEQTGRMNRSVDHRADWYSLGVTLFELFSDRLPHESDDPLESVHFHIAGQAPALTDIDSAVPPAVSDIVAKLLQKSPEDRYQSAAGIVADLGKCVDQLRAGKLPESFPLGTADIVDRFEPPEKLYGRDREIGELMKTFERVAGGSAEAMLVSGGAGIGKTSLVREIYKPITERRGYFVAGKYDQLRQDAPFSALVDALQDLVSQLLTESEESVDRWRRSIRQAIGVNGRVIVDVIPMLELIIGPQPAVAALTGIEAENRFKLVFKSFVQVFAKRTHPLVLFLDDMQWSDAASLNLVTALLAASDTESMLVVQAYRDTEIGAAHAFTLAVKEQESLGVQVGSLALEPLPAEDVGRLVADTLHQPADATAGLAAIVHRKTGGNPFFVLQFLQSLHADGLIAFDPGKRAFSFDLGRIGTAGVTENVAELLSAKLEKLAPGTGRALQLAAAVGRRFDLGTLAMLCGCSEVEAASRLAPALDDGLVVPLSELETLEPERFDSALGYRRLKFLHDRVQRAAYDLIDAAERPAIHLAIGRIRLGQSSDGQLDRRLFDIVNHMNQGIDLIDDPAEERKLAELNLRAGAKARNSTAYSLAIRCYRHVIDLLGGEQSWTGAPRLALEAHMGLAEVLALAASYEPAFEVIEDTLAHAASVPDRAAAHALKVNTYLGMGQMPEALACGRDAAIALGVDLPDGDTAIERALDAEIGAILSRTDALGVEALIDLPRMQDPGEIAIMSLLTHCLPAAYQTNQQLFALICCKMVSLSLERGNCPLSARAYGSFAALLSSALDKHAEAHRFARLAVNLAHHLDEPSVYAGAHFLLAMFTSHWNEPIEHSIELFRQSVEYGLQYGDHVHAAYSAARRVSHQQFRGMPLPELNDEAVAAAALLQSMGDLTNMEFLEPRMRYIAWLRGERPQGNTLASADRTEAECTAEIRQRGNLSFESDWFMLLARQRYHCGELEEAYAFAREAEALIPFSAGFVTRAEHAFYYSLIAAALYDSAAPEQQGELLAIIEQNLARLEGWAEGAPTNYRPLYLLLAAERARIRGDVLEAMQDYDVAIAEATNQGFAQIEALGAELAARFWQTRKKPDFVSIYLGKALEAYEIWGAAGKVEDLRAAYGLRPRHDKSHPLTAGSTTMGGTTEHGDALDLGTALKASQAIAGEIVLDRLVAKMMGIILENAGADHAALVIESDGEFLVQGTKSARGGEAEVMLGQPLNRSRRLSRGIVNYVIRTNEHVALTDPALRGRFSKDPYVCEHRPKSVLCAPILYKGKLTGVVYLENNQVAGAFTPNRLEALNVLMSQIAISIDNATLYSRLEQQAHSIEQANTALATEVGERKAAEKELSRYRDHLEELVAQRTRELENAQGRLVELSRRAGMAEVAAGVLHNVGNVMNSVNVGAHVARDAIRELRVESLAKVADELQQQSGRLGEYLSTDPAGSRIPEYLAKLAKALGADKERIRIELERLLEHLEHMKRVIAAQQSYAKTNGVTEVCTVTEILDTALSISEVALRNASVQVVTQTDTDEPALLDRHQVLQILINLISNAKHAVQENDPADRRIRISIARNDGFFCVEVTDNGAGITPENLPQVFNHGFTTKKTGHGFGLHNCANAAQEMGGSLEAFSAGPGRGARFLLRLPVRPADSAALRSGAA